MIDWDHHAHEVGEARIIAALGGFILVLSVVRILIWRGVDPLWLVLVTDLLIVLPGLRLLYGAYELPGMDVTPEALPIIVERTFLGLIAAVGIVGLLAFGSSLNRPLFVLMAGIALGGYAGFAIGLNEARAYSEAHEAEEARRAAERHRNELRQEHDLRERILQTSPIGIAIVDADGTIRMVNEHAARITGVSKSDLEGRTYDDAPIFETAGDTGTPTDGGIFQRMLTSGEPVYDVERSFTRQDGEQLWISLNGAPLYDSEEDVTALVFAFKDVTERKEYQRKLEESNERLEQFAYVASHDLQEPLRMISSYLHLLEDRSADDLDDEAREFIEFAVDGAERMREMIEDLLAYSRINTQVEPLEPTDPNGIMENVLADLRMKIEENDAEIEIGDLPTILADENQLEQLFQNLISNAIKYRSDEPPRIEIDADERGDARRFRVSDNGIGMDPDQTDRIFDVFERLHTTEEYSGTGIGLALCEKIVSRHGGEIWVESEPGEGSTFYFTIPTSKERDGDEDRADTSLTMEKTDD